MENAENLENELQEMNYRDRLNAIADDMVSGTDIYRVIDTHKLAELAGAPPPPSDHCWTHIYFAVQHDFEELLEIHEEEIVFRCAVQYLKGKVDAARLALIEEALAHFENGEDDVDISFLTPEEKKLIETALMEEELKDGEPFVVARTCIGSPKGVELWFEGDIEDDGDCIHVRTPYDYRDGKFTDVGPVTEEVVHVPWNDNFSDAIH